MVDDTSSDGSTSYDESDSSSEFADDRAWTCDDIYPTKAVTKAGTSTLLDDSSSLQDDSLSSDDSSKLLTKATPKAATPKATHDASSGRDGEQSSPAVTNPKPEAVRPRLLRHSSGEIEYIVNAQSEALEKAKHEEEKRRAYLELSKDEFEARNSLALSVSQHMDKEFEELSNEYDSSDEAIKDIQKKIDEKFSADRESNSRHSEEKAKFEKRNLEREMRLAKARERIEKKKDEEATKAQQERLKNKEVFGKLDMSKSARVERAYSWYSRMGMPSRDKMKERVEFMPASSGVTPDDVDLLPWNARGSFVSVAAMMRMNRTASTTGSSTAAASSGKEADSDSD